MYQASENQATIIRVAIMNYKKELQDTARRIRATLDEYSQEYLDRVDVDAQQIDELYQHLVHDVEGIWVP